MELITFDKNGEEITTSLKVAEVFSKNHRDVLRSITNLDCSKKFRERNFALSSYNSEQGKDLPMWEMTKDGFTFLAMGFRGEKAAEFKERYIEEFNKRGEELKRIQLEQQRMKDLELNHFWQKEEIKDLYR